MSNIGKLARELAVASDLLDDVRAFVVQARSWESTPRVVVDVSYGKSAQGYHPLTIGLGEICERRFAEDIEVVLRTHENLVRHAISKLTEELRELP